MKKILVTLSLMFATSLSFGACTSEQIDIVGDGTNCIDTKFTVTTSATDSFEFAISASGTFYIDCGNGGILSGTGASNKTITRNDTNITTYTCSWNSANTQTVLFAGSATGYSTDNTTAAIRFNISDGTDTNAKKITGISGALCTIFSALNSAPSGATTQPKFYRTFYKSSSLQTLPEDLFLGLSSDSIYKMFESTFSGSGITTIPENLFQNVSARNYDLFMNTFRDCTSLRSIPSGLFKNIKDGQGWMFSGTFAHCTSLKSIPDNLFSNISVKAVYMFAGTFYGCTNLTGYIPSSTFAGLISKGSPSGTGMWQNTFYDTQLYTTCPNGTTEVNTGYQSEWDGKVSCAKNTDKICAAGEYLPRYYDSCTVCPSNSACIGGTYTFSETIDQGIQSCASDTYSPSGSAICYPHILHVGDNNVYLKSTKQTTPSLNIKIGNDIFYAHMTTVPTKMNKDSTRYFRVQWPNNDYYVCDDTTCPQ